MFFSKDETQNNKPSSEKNTGFYIAGIGASAGGLEAYKTFFSNMKANSNIAFVLVTHQRSDHVSLMPEIISKCTKMKIHWIEEGLKAEPDNIYLSPPDKNVALLRGAFQLTDPQDNFKLRMSIDFFFRSLARDQGEKAICIILSGMGTDGSNGLKAIREEIGMVMVQSPDTAKYDSMPRCAIETDAVDYILPPDQMPEKLSLYVRHALMKTLPKSFKSDETLKESLKKIFTLLKSVTGHDFSDYKLNTIYRRIERRMDVLHVDSIKEYVSYLQMHKIEVQELFKDILIGVTNFFRDSEAFDILKKVALPGLLKDKPKDYLLRIWIPGCATGEEAYSFAILLREITEQLNKHYGIQIFATDIAPHSIEIARNGIFPASISVDVNPERLKRFFVKEDCQYRIRNDIREMLVFAPQNLIKDPPFTKLDIICCRNLLIYLNRELQTKLIPTFHYSLNPGGILFLGSSETIGNSTDLFSTLDNRWKIFKREESISAYKYRPNFSPSMPILTRGNHNDNTVNLDIVQMSEKALINHYVPPSVVVNEFGEILYIHGKTGKYLELSPGEANMNIFDMARDGLKNVINTAIRRANNDKNTVIYKKIRIKINSESQTINLTVRPIEKIGAMKNLFIVSFEDIITSNMKESLEEKITSHKNDNKNLKSLEKELQYTKDNLQTTIEELETSNEELKSSNEELQSTNEELQSTNEELETSKEEQQSLNEELTTVNAELQGKIEELTINNNDMKNLLDSINIPTIFLDMNLCINRFTRHATDVINLIHTDIGRPLSDIATKFKKCNMTEVAGAVLNDLSYREKIVETTDGKLFSMKILPYRTLSNVIDGVVITFLDVTLQKRIEEKLAEEVKGRYETAQKLLSLFEISPDFICIVDQKGNIQFINQKLSNIPVNEIIGRSVYEILPEFSNDDFKKGILKVFQTEEPFRLRFEYSKQDKKTCHEIQIIPLKNDNNNISALLWKKDISELLNINILDFNNEKLNNSVLIKQSSKI